MVQYDMSITNETQRQPEAKPIPAAAPARPTTVSQRRPSQFDQGPISYNGAGSGQGISSGQFTGGPGGSGQYGNPGLVTGGSIGAGQYGAGSGQYGAGSGQFNTATQPVEYSDSPRFSSTPVDWGSSSASTTATTGSTHRPTEFSAQRPGEMKECMQCTDGKFYSSACKLECFCNFVVFRPHQANTGNKLSSAVSTCMLSGSVVCDTSLLLQVKPHPAFEPTLMLGKQVQLRQKRASTLTWTRFCILSSTHLDDCAPDTSYSHVWG